MVPLTLGQYRACHPCEYDDFDDEAVNSKWAAMLRVQQDELVMHDSLVNLCTYIYHTKAIETVKRVLYSCDAFIDCGVRHQRRQGPSKDKTNMEDFLLAFHRCSDLLKFVASDHSRLPPLSIRNINFAHLLYEFQGMRAEMTKLRDEVQLFKATTQVPQRDRPWWKPTKVNTTAVNTGLLPLVVNLPAAPQENSSKAAPPKTNASNVAKLACAIVSFETCESEPVDNQQHGETDDDGYTRVTRTRPARPRHKAVIGTTKGVSLKARSVRFVCVCLSPC